MLGTERRQAPESPPLAVHRAQVWYRHETLIRLVAVIALLWGAVYLGWRIGWSGQDTDPVVFILLLAAELFGWISLGLYAFMAWRVPESVRPPRPDRLPTVDVFVCTYDEPVRVIEATLVGCAAIAMPHVTSLLDDGRRPEVAALAAKLGARYVTRKDNANAKAGNINHALSVTTGELILCLDADHVPRPDVLDATVGYFSDSRVALVQTPHDFLNRDSAQHTRPARHEQTLFYDVIAPGKDRHNAMFWCGSATLLRRAALEDVGGVLIDTVAEDFHTSIAIHARGWKTCYHNEILVQGIAPHDLAAFLLQRARWARGNLAVLRTSENPATCRGLTAAQRVSYLSSLGNYFGSIQRAVLLGVLMVMLGAGVLPMRASPALLAIFWLPWALLAFASSGALGRGTLGPFDSTRYGLMTMGIHVRGAVALITRRTGTFKVTPKDGIDTGGWQVFRALGLLTTIGSALLVAWVLRLADVVGVIDLPDLPGFATAIALALGVWEFGCIAFVLGSLARRRQLRHQYRFPAQIRARVARTQSVVSVVDLTPDGLAFLSPLDVPVGQRFELLTRLPGASGPLRDLKFGVEVRSCHAAPRSRYRVGCRIDTDEATRLALVEYCYVAQPAERLGADVAVRSESDAVVRAEAS
jgi:cellulose synthase (UDP-forming)